MAFDAAGTPAGSAPSTPDGTQIDIPRTAEDCSGKLIVIVVRAGGGVTSLSLPSGFTQIGSTVAGNLLAWKAGTASEPANYTVSGFADDYNAAQAFTFTGRNTSSPITDFAVLDNSAGSSATQADDGSLVPAAGDDLLYFVGGYTDVGANISLVTPPLSFTARGDAVSPGTAWANVLAATRDNVSAGAYGAVTGVVSDAGTHGTVFSVAIKEASAGGGGEVSCTPMHDLSNSFGPALAARLNGVLQ